MSAIVHCCMTFITTKHSSYFVNIKTVTSSRRKMLYSWQWSIQYNTWTLE